MKINIYNTHDPCTNCYIHGHEYSEDSDYCQRCEHNIYVQILKEVLKQNDGCLLCMYSESIGGGYIDCTLEHNIGCEACNDYTIDLDATIEDYKLNVNR